MGTAYHELARGVDKQLVVARGKESPVFVAQARQNAGDKDFLYVLPDALQHGLFLVEFVVLGRDDDGLDALGFAIVGIFDSYLALGIGAQIKHLFPLLSDAGEFLQEDMRQGDGQRHQLGSLVAGIAEHHALVARALLLGFGTAHALIDVSALPVDGGKHPARVGLEHILALGVANAADDIAHGVLYLDIAVARHFTAHHHKTCGDQCLARHMAVGVATKELVQK